MLDTLTPGQLAEWMGYYLLEPWGDAWRQAALGAFATLKTQGGNGARRLKLDDLLPVPKRRRVMSAAELETAFKQFAMAHNASLKD